MLLNIFNPDASLEMSLSHDANIDSPKLHPVGTSGWDIYTGYGLMDAYRAVCELPFNDVYCGYWAQDYINEVY